jgi:hypothetical protein
MRSVFGSFLVTLLVLSASAHGAERLDIVKVKTGILPGGGFYSLYQVDCLDDRTAAIASLDRKRRWCTLHEGDISCSSSRQEASFKACSTITLAAAEDNAGVVGNE